MLKQLLVFIVACAFVWGNDIQVHLPTQNPRAPIYIDNLKSKNAAWDLAYLEQLHSILMYDLNYTGLLQVVTTTVPFSVQWNVSGSHLNASVTDTRSGLVKHYNEIKLSGKLDQDRRQIHKLADTITLQLCHKQGIASTRILYSHQKDGATWQAEIWECDWDGANARPLTHEGSYCITPVQIPSSSRFLYVSYKIGQPKIYANGETGERVVSLPGNQLLPAISPRLDKIAFISDASGRTDLFLQPINLRTGEKGKPVQLYSYPNATQASPTFNRDGSQLAFVSDKDGGMRIYIISATPHAQRSSARMISKKNRENSCPSWSPDGRKLAYSAKTNGIRQIWIYDFDTEEEWQLTSGEGNKENPCWAPDGLHLVFNSTNSTSSELYVVNLNQPEALKISKGSGHKHYPNWGAK